MNERHTILTATIKQSMTDIFKTDTDTNQNESKHDVWTLSNDEPCMNRCDRLPVPSFIRLFVINRLISDAETATPKENLVNQYLNNEKTCDKLHAHNILSLLRKHGIKKYMNQCYNEKRDLMIIETIFNKIILKKFEHEHKES